MKLSKLKFELKKTIKEVIKQSDGSLKVLLSDNTEIETDVVMVAIGRVPNTKLLKLENT